MRARLIAVAANLALTAIALEARAGGQRRPTLVAVVELKVAGDAVPELRTQLHDGISRGLRSVGRRMIGYDDVRRALGETGLLGCVSSACLHQIREMLGAPQFLSVHIEATGSAYAFTLQLLSAEVDGQVERRLEQSCPVCTLADLSKLVAVSVREIISTPPQDPVKVVIVTRPEGAALRIDERRAGYAPLVGELFPGPHRIHAAKRGYLDADQLIHVGGGSAKPQRFELILTPDESTLRPYQTWKWITAASSALGLASGVVFVSRCNQDPRRNAYECFTASRGTLSLAIGVGLGVTSSWMFARDRRDREERSRLQVTVWPQPGGAVGAVTWRFP